MNPPESSGSDGDFSWLPKCENLETDHFAAIDPEFWEAVEPPAPDEQAWAALRDGIAQRLAAHRSRQSARWLIAAALLPLAALAGWLARPRVEHRVANPAPASAKIIAATDVDDPLAVFAVLPMAEADDVAVEAIHGDMPTGSLLADTALPEELALAEPGDVILIEVRGETPMTKLTLGPNDAPMIYASATPIR